MRQYFLLEQTDSFLSKCNLITFLCTPPLGGLWSIKRVRLYHVVAPKILVEE